MLIYLTLLIPILGGAVLPLFKFRTVKARLLYTETVVLVTSALTAWVLLSGDHEAHVVYYLMDGLPITFRSDGIGSVFAGLSAFLWPFATLYGMEYMTHEERPDTFFAFYTLSFGVTLSVAFAANLFTLYTSFECLTMATLPLVWHKKDKASNNAGRKYVAYSITGAAMAFVSMVFIIRWGGTTDFTAGGVLDPAKISGREDILRALWLLAFIGFGTKAAVFPMYAWLPTVSVAPTPVTALLHAVAVVNAGAFAVLRVTVDSFGTALLFGSWAQTAALAVACFTIVFGSAMAVREQHLKRRLAYSTVSNLSYMMMGIALMTQAGAVGALTHMVFHGLMKITLFWCTGAILVRTGREYIQDIRGLSKAMPFTCAVFTIGAVALTGTPPFCGFISKLNLLTAAEETGLVMGKAAIACLIVSAILTALYTLSVACSMYFRPAAGELEAGKDPGWMMKVPFAVMCVLMLVFGVWSGPIVSYLRSVCVF